jgi:hypothetical protein
MPCHHPVSKHASIFSDKITVVTSLLNIKCLSQSIFVDITNYRRLGNLEGEKVCCGSQVWTLKYPDSRSEMAGCPMLHHPCGNQCPH